MYLSQSLTIFQNFKKIITISQKGELVLYGTIMLTRTIWKRVAFSFRSNYQFREKCLTKYLISPFFCNSLLPKMENLQTGGTTFRLEMQLYVRIWMSVLWPWWSEVSGRYAIGLYCWPCTESQHFRVLKTTLLVNHEMLQSHLCNIHIK